MVMLDEAKHGKPYSHTEWQAYEKVHVEDLPNHTMSANVKHITRFTKKRDREINMTANIWIENFGYSGDSGVPTKG